jgi:hypothetical protein
MLCRFSQTVCERKLNIGRRGSSRLPADSDGMEARLAKENQDRITAWVSAAFQ